MVDLGCGSGADLLTLAKRARHPKNRFVGLDSSEKGIAVAAVDGDGYSIGVQAGSP